MSKQTNATDNQTNENQESGSNETTQSHETNHDVDLKSLQEMMVKQAAVLEKLSDKPEEINPEGLKHLQEQTLQISQSLTSLESSMETKTQAGSEAMSKVQALEMEIARRDVMSEYGFSKEDMELFSKFDTKDEMEAFAKKLSEKLKANAPKPRFNFGEGDKKAEVPEHLKHLLP